MDSLDFAQEDKSIYYDGDLRIDDKVCMMEMEVEKEAEPQKYMEVVLACPRSSHSILSLTVEWGVKPKDISYMLLVYTVHDGIHGGVHGSVHGGGVGLPKVIPFHAQPLTKGDRASKPKIPRGNQLTTQQNTQFLVIFTFKADVFLSSQVLNSGGQLQISRPAPEPPRTNGGSNVYQQPHQHVNSNGTYGEYVGQRTSEEEG